MAIFYLTSQVELDYQKSSLCIKNYLDVYIPNQKTVFKYDLKRSSQGIIRYLDTKTTNESYKTQKTMTSKLE